MSQDSVQPLKSSVDYYISPKKELVFIDQSIQNHTSNHNNIEVNITSVGGSKKTQVISHAESKKQDTTTKSIEEEASSEKSTSTVKSHHPRQRLNQIFINVFTNKPKQSECVVYKYGEINCEKPKKSTKKHLQITNPVSDFPTDEMVPLSKVKTIDFNENKKHFLSVKMSDKSNEKLVNFAQENEDSSSVRPTKEMSYVFPTQGLGIYYTQRPPVILGTTTIPEWKEETPVASTTTTLLLTTVTVTNPAIQPTTVPFSTTQQPTISVTTISSTPATLHVSSSAAKPITISSTTTSSIVESSTVASSTVEPSTVASSTVESSTVASSTVELSIHPIPIELPTQIFVTKFPPSEPISTKSVSTVFLPTVWFPSGFSSTQLPRTFPVELFTTATNQAISVESSKNEEGTTKPFSNILTGAESFSSNTATVKIPSPQQPGSTIPDNKGEKSQNSNWKVDGDNTKEKNIEIVSDKTTTAIESSMHIKAAAVGATVGGVLSLLMLYGLAQYYKNSHDPSINDFSIEILDNPQILTQERDTFQTIDFEMFS